MPAPPEIPVIDYSSPQFDDLMLIDSINTTTGKFDDLPCGTPHPNAGKYPGYVLVLKKPFPGDEKWIQRYWTADPVAENTYNLARQEFDLEDASKSIFTRTYLVRRTEYISANIPAKGSALTGVIGIRMTATGSGYDATTTVSFSGGGGGSGAAATPIVFRGAVVGIYITAEGTGYTSAPAVAINGPGTGATATALLQPATAVLTKEWADRMEGQPEDGLYLKITRVYRILPGATRTAKEFDEYGALVTTTEQTVVAGTVPTNTVVAGVPHVQSLIPEDTVIARLRDESRIVGSIVVEREKADPDVPGSRVRFQYYLVLASTTIPDDDTTNTYQRKRFPKDANVLVEIRTTYTVPDSYIEDVEGSFSFPTLFESATILRGTDFGLIWNRREGFSKVVIFKHYISFSTARVQVTPDALVPASWHMPFGFADTALTPSAEADRTYTFTDENSNVLTAVIPLSTPSRDTYIADWIGQEKIVGGSSVIWRAGIYKTTVIKVVMQ